MISQKYHPTRLGDVPKQFLKNYEGFLQTDGYRGYNRAAEGDKIIHMGCFAHARRYFEKAWQLNKKSNIAYRGLEYIRKIYAAESELHSRSVEPESFVEKRKKTLSPILEEFCNWLEAQKDSVVPKSKTGEAIAYCLSEWQKLIGYLNHHLLTPDNNLIENVIRPFVVGRKNWFFSNTPLFEAGIMARFLYYFSCFKSFLLKLSSCYIFWIPLKNCATNKIQTITGHIERR